ncbi:class I SAM-dependent methyltransferase [Micromonospora craniellae]|uniref:Class I SAM-dependent methyltransferase n=1 Tax=Micromonospora craniellae TaxID=2294034 RepID=A0A372FZC0_9ACTN|nr:class I SAM-dependent methyltransferase [Micromonospora craniellae]QOC93429.1 class I SAM-dependent methyltransferase [Micromonospora craniellae]RFS45876.1 class I SAM-dependent methyltransferase [Micromonospora craniellae]
MSTDTPVSWDALVPQLVDAARQDRTWYLTVARELVGPADRLAVDVGCGAAGMSLAIARMMACGRVVAVDASPAVLAAAHDHIRSGWSDPRVRIELVCIDFPAEIDALRETLGTGVDLVWASAAIHHVGDQQAAVTALADLLAPGGRMALAEGGLPEQHLPWDVGLGEPGLEVRLHAAQDRWFARMRAELPDSRRMPYGWTEALRRAGLCPVTTRTILDEQPAPLADVARRTVLDALSRRVAWLRPTGLLSDADLSVWERLLDPADERWLGHRDDLFRLSARSVHLGVRPDPP